jgi:drug/metabolite transporter (DMT)-like permease
MMPARPVAAWSAFFTCAAIWGSTFLFIAIGNDALPPVWGAMWRLALAAAILIAIARLRGQALPSGRALRFTVIYGILMYGINFPLLYWGELSAPSGVSAVMYATLPLTTPLMATAMGIERLQSLKLAGGAVAFVGVAVIFWQQLAGEVSFWHLAAVLAAATIAGFGTVVLKMGPRQAPIPVNGVASLVGCAMCFAISFLIREPHPIPSTAAQIIPVLYLSVMGSIVAFTLLAWLVNHWDPTNISFISVVNPVVAVTLGVIVRDEQVGASLLAGAAMVLAGVVMAAQSDRMARKKAAVPVAR